MKKFEKDNEVLGERLRAVRKRLGWTQRKMAVFLNLDSTYVSQLENGRKPVDESYVLRAEAAEREKPAGPRATGSPDEMREGVVAYMATLSAEDKLRLIRESEGAAVASSRTRMAGIETLKAAAEKVKKEL